MPRFPTSACCYGLAYLLLGCVSFMPMPLRAESGGGHAVDLSHVASPAERIRFLRAEIARHDELYYRKAQPEISDADYDALKNELVALNEQFPEEAARLGPSPIAAIGDDRTPGFPAAAHRAPMLSLEKVYTEAALKEFCRKTAAALAVGGEPVTFVVEPKFDGLGVSAVYENGRLVRVITRGDGREGDDVTANARQIAALPVRLRAPAGEALPEFIELRGEVYLPFAEFDRLNCDREEAGEVAFASPRNLAAGTLKSADPALVAWRKLEVVFYGMGACEPKRTAPTSQRGLIDRLRAWGMPTVEQAATADSPESVWRAVQALGRLRAELPYPTDGAVVKIDSASAQRQLGASDRAPRWAVAFKYSPERAATRLRAVTIQVGRTGVLTPVAELEPVRLGGATISRATLHNAAEIARRDIRVGDMVFVERTGEVIPAVVGVDLGARDPACTPFTFPAKCPACGAAAVRRDGEISWRCLNPDCPAQLRRRLLHFASPDGVGIRGLREATIDKLVEKNLVRDLSDLYRLRREDLLALGRTNAKSTETLLAAIAATRHVELWRFISGLGIPGVGAAGAKSLAAHFTSLDAMMTADADALAEVAGIGPETARAAAAFFRDDSVRRMLAAFQALGVWPTAHGSTAGTLLGRTIVITGSLPTLTRARAVELIEAAGGKLAESVSAKTAFVVAGSEAGAKSVRAKELGVPIIDEAELLRRISGEEAHSK